MEPVYRLDLRRYSGTLPPNFRKTQISGPRALEPQGRLDLLRAARARALVSKDDFDRVQAMIGARARRHKPHKPAPTHRVYLLGKRLRCGICSRRLQGHWVHHQPYHRCSYPPEYQAATGLDHPRTVYLREADLLPHLDQWLARLFDPDHLDPTLDALEQASNDHTATTQQLDAAEQAIADSKRQLAQYRAALAAGADPTEVTAWINQATAAKAERARLRATTPTTLDRATLRRIVTQAGGLLTALDSADRTRRAALYDKLGIEGIYQPTQRLVVMTADLVCQWLVSEGGLEPPRPCGH
jgi:site-specific DNA recombinase